MVMTNFKKILLCGVAVMLSGGGYLYWTHEELRLPTANEASVMEEVCPAAEAVIETEGEFYMKHPEIPFIRACKLYEDRSLVRADFWGILRARRQDARNAILEASRDKIAKATADANVKLARQQAESQEQLVAARNKADADIARQQREAAELQEYNKPENVQRRKDIEDLKIANQNEATAREEKEANSEASRLDRESRSIAKVERAKAKSEAARQRRDAASRNVTSAPSDSGREVAAGLSMTCGLGVRIIYSGSRLFALKVDGTEKDYPVTKVETSPDGITVRGITKYGRVAAFYATSVNSVTRVFWTNDKGSVVQECIQ
jgi:hypothetical protein